MDKDKYHDSYTHYYNGMICMKSVMIKTLGDEEYECVNMLVKCGFRKIEAEVLVYLTACDHPVKSSDVEKGVGHAQPDISVAAKMLSKHGYIKINRNEKNTHSPRVKGRPALTYSAIKTPGEILDEILKNRDKETKMIKEVLAKMKK